MNPAGYKAYREKQNENKRKHHNIPLFKKMNPAGYKAYREKAKRDTEDRQGHPGLDLFLIPFKF